jgi:hypothetical protein
MASLLSLLVPPDFDLGDVDFMHNLGKARLTQPEQAIVVLTGYRPGFTSVANPLYLPFLGLGGIVDFRFRFFLVRRW